MGTQTEEIIKALQNISAADNQQVKDVLIAKFKHDFPENLDWLAMFSDDKVVEFENYQTQLPEIKGYKLIKKIGSGASGQVFLATELNSNKKVAIKIPMIFLTAEQMHRFAHESRLLSRLAHPNIAHIEKTGLIEKDNLPFIVMEYVDGKTIHQYCKDEQLNFKQIIELFKQVLDAVQYAHNKGIVHRDIKPENILVTNQGQVKLLDFGIALATNNSTQQLTQLTKTGEIVGTLAYMSPEQVSGNDDLDTRADVYSLGVVLYQLLSDSLPYQVDAGKIFAAISQIIEDLPKKLTTSNHKVDANLATIVHHAIEKNPEARYQSPRDFKNDLDNWIKGEGISVKQQSLWHSLKHLAKQHKAIVTGAALAVAGLVLGLVFAVSFALKEQKARELAETNRIRAEVNATTSQRTSNFITQLFAKANPDNIYGDKLTLLQVIDNAEIILKEELKDEIDVEANIRTVLAEVYISLGREKKAKEQLLNIEKLLPELTNKDNLENLQFKKVFIESDINLYSARFEENIKHLEQFIREPKFTLDHQIRLKDRLAFSYASIGKFDKAKVLLDELADIFKSKSFNEKSGDILDIKMFSNITLAKVYEMQSQYGKAKDIYKTLEAQLIEKYGPSNSQTFNARGNVALAEINLENYDKGITLLKELVQEEKEVLGEKHLLVLISRSNIFYGLGRQKNIEEALRYGMELLPDMIEQLGETHQNTMIVKNNLAYLQEDSGNVEQAQKSYLQIINDYESLGDAFILDKINVYNNLAMLFYKKKNYKEAEKLYKKGIKLVKEKKVNKETFYYINLISNYAWLLTDLHNYDKAQEYIDFAYKNFLKFTGEESRFTMKAKKLKDKLAQTLQ